MTQALMWDSLQPRDWIIMLNVVREMWIPLHEDLNGTCLVFVSE